MNFEEALRDLEGRQPEGNPQPDLRRIAKLTELLDHPELTYPSIQVTGTNGKSTTARLVTSLACAHGLTVGTFTSPHVTSVAERLSTCGEEITHEEFGEEYERLLAYFERVDASEGRVTYFEALTALAYLWFADKPVGLGVFEVGMGGTWDATNLVSGDVAVLCPVGLDHPELGSTVAAVASEKAGIIKPGRTAVVREQRPDAMKVIEDRAKEVEAELLVEGTAFSLTRRGRAVGGQALVVHGSQRTYDEIFIPLFGEQASRNAAAAIVACEAFFGRALDEGIVRAALARVTSPGRMEVVARHPLVVLDGAHNVDAAEALSTSLDDAFAWRNLHLVVGMFADKDVTGVLSRLAGISDRAYACSNKNPRSAPPARLAQILHELGLEDVETFTGVRDAVEAARSHAEEDDLILVTGSFYTVAEARPLFLGA